LDKAIQYCTNASDFYLDDSPLFVFQNNLGNKNLSIQFDKKEGSLSPGQEPTFAPSLVPSQAWPKLDLIPRKSVSFDTHRDVRLFYSTKLSKRIFYQLLLLLLMDRTCS
jgi:hypothetical protein